MDSDSQFGAAALQNLRPRLKTENTMQFGSPFLSLFPNPPPLVIKTVQGFPGVRAEEKSESHRSHTSEQKKVIEEVTHAFSVQSNTSEADSVDMLIARDKL